MGVAEVGFAMHGRWCCTSVSSLPFFVLTFPTWLELSQIRISFSTSTSPANIPSRNRAKYALWSASDLASLRLTGC